ncbi:MAG: extracellular solute-binding protein [Bacteroidota bacterium]|nr:extracellular solute-binding protein [Bacteroidota bacterium]
MHAHPHRLALLLIPASVLLAFCGSRRSGDVVVYSCSANALEIRALEEDIPSFTAQTGIRLALNPFSGDEKLLAMISAGNEPDIFYAATALRDRLAAEGKLLDLRTVSAGDPFVERLTQAARSDGISLDGGWYGCPNWVFTCGVYYNRALFARAGIPMPDSSWTWDDMVAAARALTKDEDGDGKTDRYGVFIGTHFIEVLELMNGACVGRDNLFLEIGREAGEVHRRYMGLIAEGIMPDPRRIQAMGMPAPQMLESGRVAMLLEAVPHANLYETLTIPWGVVPVPSFPGKTPRYFRSRSGGLCISAKTQDPRRTWEALKWIIGGARFYQPNPVLRDADFVAGWEKRYPRLRGSGFRTVWERGMRDDSEDPRYFVRFSCWSMHAVMERLQPLLDRMFAGAIDPSAVAAAVPSINAAVHEELRRTLEDTSIRPAFRKALEQKLRAAGSNPLKR